MCGIAGLLSRSRGVVARDDLARMASALHHRGPDDAGFGIVAGGALGLAHTRLSVVDIEGGAQPVFSDDGAIALAYNGEIYDHAELRRELEERGHVFRTRSDTEVVLRLYEEHGVGALDRLNGEFAFLLWDGRRRRLLAVRDYAGVKPLYYRETPGELAFASEAKALFALGRGGRALSRDYLTGPLFGAFPAAFSAFEGVRSVAPGHYLVVNLEGRVEEHAYFRPKYKHVTARSFEEARREVLSHVARAVARRLVADVPAHVYLSGGLDSTIVCSQVARAGRPFNAYSIAFPGTPYDEGGRAEAIARHFGATFRRLDCAMNDLAEALPDTLRHTETVIVNPGAVAKLLLARLVRSDGQKVCLTGEGADELFAGYPYFKLEAFWRMMARGGADARRARELFERFRRMEVRSEGIHWNRQTSWNRPDPLFGYPSFFEARAAQYAKIMPLLFETEALGIGPEDRPHIAFRRSFDVPWMRSLDPMDATREITFRQLYGYMIPNLADRVEMASSVECRTPFLDRDLLELAFTLPPEHLLDLDTLREKRVLHAAFVDDLPAFQRDEHKHPFMSPDWRAFAATRRGRELFEDLLSEGSVRRAGIFRPRFVKAARLAWSVLPQGASLNRKLDALVGILLGVQLLSRLFVEHATLGDPSFPMVDRTPEARRVDRVSGF